MSVSFRLRPIISDQVLVHDILLADDLLLEPLVLFLLVLSSLIALALVVRIFMIHTIVEVLIVELLVLTVELTHTRIEPDSHILVNEQTLNLLVYGFGLRTCLGIKWTQNHRPGGIILHQSVIVRIY
jgi:hypothetical protein